MASLISHTTVNTLDAYTLSCWWRDLLGWTDVPGDPNEPGHEECMIVDPATGRMVLFIEVDELQPKEGRFHFDLMPTDRTRDEEIQRVLELGARQVADRRNPDGTGWMVLADPDGNQFCVIRSAEERAAAGDPPLGG